MLRALSLVATNRPSGTEYVTHGESKCEVTLDFDDHVLKRCRGERINTYHLDGKEFAAFGSSVPDEIAQALKLDEINFQRQLDGPFWLGDPASKVARELNRIVDLGLIDEALANVANECRRLKAAVELTEKRKDEAKHRANATDFIDAFSVRVERASSLHKKLSDLTAQRYVLSSSLEEIARLREAAEQAAPDFSPADETASRLKELTAERDSLCELLSRIAFSESERSRTFRLADRAEKELSELSPLCPTCKRPIGS